MAKKAVLDGKRATIMAGQTDTKLQEWMIARSQRDIRHVLGDQRRCVGQSDTAPNPIVASNKKSK